MWLGTSRLIAEKRHKRWKSPTERRAVGEQKRE
jgi:hypothetical protein